MKLFNTKMVLGVLAIAMLATPAFAQPYRHRAPATIYNQTAQDPVGVYPNPVTKSGSAEQAQSGVAWGLNNNAY